MSDFGAQNPHEQCRTSMKSDVDGQWNHGTHSDARLDTNVTDLFRSYGLAVGEKVQLSAKNVRTGAYLSLHFPFGSVC